MAVNYNEIGRFGSYGVAKKNAKEREGELPPGSRHYIFKDISNGPFTSFKTDAYVLVEGPVTDDTSNEEMEDEE